MSNLWFPVSVNTNCPYCAKLANFTPTYQHFDAHRKTIACTATCPSCNQVVYIWVIHPSPALDTNKKTCRCIAMYPAPKLPRQPIPEMSLMPDHIATAYHDALGVFNAALWSATATCCRRVVEGVTAEVLKTNSPATLVEQVKQLPAAVDLAKPLKTLSNTLTLGGKVDAHFNLKQEPDAATAEAMLNLVEAFLQYLFTLPAEIELLNQKLGMAPARLAAIRKPTVTDTVVMTEANAG